MEQKQFKKLFLRQQFEKKSKNVTWGHFDNLLDSLFCWPKQIYAVFFPIEQFFTSHRKVNGAKTI